MSALSEPLQLFQNPAKRVFWVYLLASILIAGLVCAVRYRRAWCTQLCKQLLSPRLWLHPSVLLDIKLIFVKAFVRATLFASWLISTYGIAIGLVNILNAQFGGTKVTFLSDTSITALYTIVLFLIADFSRYIVHRFCHELPFLWQFHQVHHSAEVMTPLTLYRSHPVENLIFITRGVLVTGVITGIFFYLFGARAIQAQILGVNALGLIFNAFGANLRHSHVWISYGSFIEHLLISPAQHQIHHSRHPIHSGTNYGSCLALWDWLGGSLQLARGQESIHFGLPDAELNHHPHQLHSALFGPFRACWRLLTAPLVEKRPQKHLEYDP